MLFAGTRPYGPCLVSLQFWVVGSMDHTITPLVWPEPNPTLWIMLELELLQITILLHTSSTFLGRQLVLFKNVVAMFVFSSPVAIFYWSYTIDCQCSVLGIWPSFPNWNCPPVWPTWNLTESKLDWVWNCLSVAQLESDQFSITIGFGIVCECDALGIWPTFQTR